jgi:hypothetical protein
VNRMRTTYRSQLEGSVQFTLPPTPESESVCGEGRLQNTSTGGICFETDKRVTPGDPIELTVFTCGSRIVFRGEVVRVEESKSGFIVGVRFDIDQADTEESLLMFAALGEE